MQLNFIQKEMHNLKNECKVLHNISFDILTKFLNGDYFMTEKKKTMNKGTICNPDKEYDYAKVVYMYEIMRNDIDQMEKYSIHEFQNYYKQQKIQVSSIEGKELDFEESENSKVQIHQILIEKQNVLDSPQFRNWKNSKRRTSQLNTQILLR